MNHDFLTWHSISKRKSRGSEAYRYRWGRGRHEWGSEQIPGPVGDALAESRAIEVRRWIASGRSPDEIKSLIQGWQQSARKKMTNLPLAPSL